MKRSLSVSMVNDFIDKDEFSLHARKDGRWSNAHVPGPWFRHIQGLSYCEKCLQAMERGLVPSWDLLAPSILWWCDLDSGLDYRTCSNRSNILIAPEHRKCYVCWAQVDWRICSVSSGCIRPQVNWSFILGVLITTAGLTTVGVKVAKFISLTG